MTLPNNYIREACVESLQDALLAEAAGANRIELCARLDLDGLTPTEALVRDCCQKLSIPVMVMIRPRAGNFIYEEEELQLMEKQIAAAKASGAHGVVLGLLTADNQIDFENTTRLVQVALPMQITFHKAIDQLDDPAEGLSALLQIQGITRILTSGGKATALEGAGKIREMLVMAGQKVIIMAAGKITYENIEEIASSTGADEFHGKRIVDF